MWLLLLLPLLWFSAGVVVTVVSRFCFFCNLVVVASVDYCVVAVAVVVFIVVMKMSLLLIYH